MVRRVQTPYAMGALTQATALFLLRHPEIMQRHRTAILAARTDLAGRLSEIPGLTVFPSATNFLLVRTHASATALDRYLRSCGILVRNLDWEDRYLRISVGTQDDHVRLADAMRAFLVGGGSGSGGDGPPQASDQRV